MSYVISHIMSHDMLHVMTHIILSIMLHVISYIMSSSSSSSRFTCIGAATCFIMFLAWFLAAANSLIQIHQHSRQRVHLDFLLPCKRQLFQEVSEKSYKVALCVLWVGCLGALQAACARAALRAPGLAAQTKESFFLRCKNFIFSPTCLV